MTKQTVTIIKKNVAELVRNIDKLNKKAVKLGCETMVLSFDNPTTKTITTNQHGVELVTPLILEYIDATLEYNIPIIEGYELIATLDIFPGENNDEVLISAVPNKVIPDSHKTKNEIHCDHCGWKRNRHHSVLLQHTETGEYKEVGSTCVKDFFGHDPRGFLMMAGIDFQDFTSRWRDEDSLRGDRTVYSYSLKEVLSVTSAVINKFGWLSKGKAYEFGGQATAYRVFDNLDPDPTMLKFHRDDLVSVEQENINLAVDTIKYFETLEADDNDYLLNCIKIANLGYVPYKYMGFACSMINAYEKAMFKKDEAERAAKLPASEYVGEIGDRLTNIQVNIIFTKEIESQWGFSTLYIFQDSNGNVYKTFYSGSKWSYEKGDEVLITGTVKKHDEYQDKKSTILNRVIAKDAPKEMFKPEDFNVV